MTWEMIYDLMKQGKAAEVHEEGCLTVYWLQLAVKKGWMSREEAEGWADSLFNL